jgi:DNA-binding GntR family transcriptional regulator
MIHRNPHTGLTATATATDATIEAKIYAAVSAALLDGRLLPGTPLRERNLADVFGCTRGAIRKVLARLGADGKLAIESNRGAFVPQPSDDDIRQLYTALKVVESGIAAQVCAHLSDKQIVQLERHVAAEKAAVKRRLFSEATRLAFEVHVLLAQLSGSVELQSFVQRMVTKAELYKALYDPAEVDVLTPAEHSKLVSALRSRRVQTAVTLITRHLDRVGSRVSPPAATGQRDFKAIFAEAPSAQPQKADRRPSVSDTRDP